MISYNLKDYLKIYEGFLDKKFCDQTIEKLKEEKEWAIHKFYASTTNTFQSFEDELSVTYSTMPEKKIIQDKMWNAINQYITKDLDHFKNWFNGWNGYTEIRFNKYDPTTKMKLHCDHIHSMFDGSRKGIPTLSIVGVLNDDFEGGEFVMWDQVIELPAGSIMIFPSSFLYPHQVTPVKKGIRYSYVSWVW